MIKSIIELLQNHQDVAQWSVLKQAKHEWQHYLIKESPEATREVDHETYVVTLYHKHPNPSVEGDAMGVATVTLTSADADQLAAKIENGLQVAALTNNPPWSLPKPADFPNVPLVDEETLEGPQRAIDQFSERLLNAVRQEEAVRLSAAEFFFEEVVSSFYNSEGVEASQKETMFTLEMVLLAKQGDSDESEHFVLQKRRRIQDMNVEELVKKNAKSARDSIGAELPNTWHGPIVLPSSMMSEFLDPVVFRASAQTKHMKLSQSEIGETILYPHEVKGDAFNISYSSTLPYGVRSYSFNKEGLPGQETSVVEANIFKSYLASQRYADYLKVPATGDASNVVLPQGTTPQAELLRGPVYYIETFSALMPNPFTGDFSAEIRLGYFIDEAGNRTPVKGGSVTGNLFAALANAKYAQETAFEGNYQGPATILLNGLTIAGK